MLQIPGFWQFGYRTQATCLGFKKQRRHQQEDRFVKYDFESHTPPPLNHSSLVHEFPRLSLPTAPSTGSSGNANASRTVNLPRMWDISPPWVYISRSICLFVCWLVGSFVCLQTNNLFSKCGTLVLMPQRRAIHTLSKNPQHDGIKILEHDPYPPPYALDRLCAGGGKERGGESGRRRYTSMHSWHRNLPCLLSRWRLRATKDWKRRVPSGSQMLHIFPVLACRKR